jgi:hypothetical protein
MQNLGNVYICGPPFVMSRTDAQNALDMVFKEGVDGEYRESWFTQFRLVLSVVKTLKI